LLSGIDVAMSLALGADLAGLARPLLQAACESPEYLGDRLELLLAELRTVMFCTGCGEVADLRRSGVLVRRG
jgi:isopentenyl-diphosphate Delta-isomerase